jgi:hypothetical protein
MEGKLYKKEFAELTYFVRPLNKISLPLQETGYVTFQVLLVTPCYNPASNHLTKVHL